MDDTSGTVLANQTIAGVQITDYWPMAMPIDSKYGRIRYEAWCKKEVERINGDPARGGAYIDYMGNEHVKTMCAIFDEKWRPNR